jgi:hypothetical protein
MGGASSPALGGQLLLSARPGGGQQQTGLAANQAKRGLHYPLRPIHPKRPRPVSFRS